MQEENTIEDYKAAHLALSVQNMHLEQSLAKANETRARVYREYNELSAEYTTYREKTENQHIQEAMEKAHQAAYWEIQDAIAEVIGYRD